MELLAQTAPTGLPEWAAPYIALWQVVGYPGVFIFGVGYVCWAILKFARPYAEKVLNEHVMLVETLRSNSERQTECIEDLANAQKAVMPAIQKLTDLKVTEHHKTHIAMTRATLAVDQLIEDHPKKEHIKRHMEEIRRELQ